MKEELPYRSGYLYQKRLNTQSFNRYHDINFDELVHKMELNVQKAKKQTRKSHHKLLRVKNQQQNLQKLQLQSRHSIRSKIDQKMRKSQSNIQQLKMERQKTNQIKHKDSQKTITLFKQQQQKQLQQSFRKSQSSQRQTTNYFQLKKNKQYQRLAKIQHSRKIVNPQKSQSNFSLNKSNNVIDKQLNKSQIKKQPKIIKINQQQLLKKHIKKQQMLYNKQLKNLGQYIQKMQQISILRSKNMKKTYVPRPTLPKVVKNQHSYSQQPRYKQSPTKIAINNRQSFSQAYSHKLKEKKQLIDFFHQVSMLKNDEIMQNQTRKSNLIKQQKLIKQVVNDTKRKLHFKYMKAILKN